MPRTWTDPLLLLKQWKVNMKFDTWNVSSLYRPESLRTAARELGRCRLGLVGIKKVMWDKESALREVVYTCFYGK